MTHPSIRDCLSFADKGVLIPELLYLFSRPSPSRNSTTSSSHYSPPCGSLPWNTTQHIPSVYGKSEIVTHMRTPLPSLECRPLQTQVLGPGLCGASAGKFATTTNWHCSQSLEWKKKWLGSQLARFQYHSHWLNVLYLLFRHYEDCWTSLVEMFGSTAILPPRTKRWAEAKVLADCVAIKVGPESVMNPTVS